MTSNLKQIDQNKLVEDVRHLIDEQELTGEAQWADTDNLPVSERILNLFKGAYNYVMLHLPARYATETEWGGDNPSWKVSDSGDEIEQTESDNGAEIVLRADPQTGTGIIELPAQCIRPTYLKMRGWKKGVSTFITEESAEYELQQNYAMRGGVVNPVVACVDDCTALRYFSLPRWMEEHQVESFRFVEEAKENIPDNKITDIAYKVLTLTLAHSVAASMGRETKAIETILVDFLQSLQPN